MSLFSIVGLILIYPEAGEVHGVFKVILIEQDFAGLKGNLRTMVYQITQGRFIEETEPAGFLQQLDHLLFIHMLPS